MADSPSEAATSEPQVSPPVSHHSSPHRSPHRSPRSRSPNNRSRGAGEDLSSEILKGAAWAPPWTAHELHSREVYARSKTPSPPCEKYKRDAIYDETSKEVVKKREQESKKTQKEAKERHKHEGIVMKRAQEFERKSRLECERYHKQLSEYKGRMKKREAEARPQFRNRAEQIIALGLNKGSPSRPGSPRR